MTFTLGLAAVWMSDALAIADKEVVVDLPSSRSADVFFIFPIEKDFMDRGGSGCGGPREIVEDAIREPTKRKRVRQR